MIQKIFKRWLTGPVFIYSGTVLTIGVAVTLLYGIILGHQQIQVREFTLKYHNLPQQFDGYKIIQISDAHLGGMSNYLGKLNRITKIVDQGDPDMLLFTGDMVNNFAVENIGWIDNFKEMTDQYPSYSILGNHDYGDYSDWNSEAKKEQNFKQILNAQRQMGFKLLLNEHVVIRSGEDSIFLAGVENWGHPPFPQYADLEQALKGVPSGAFTILMTHDPAHWESKVKYLNSIELSLSGHSHGMQWGIYFAGIPFSLAYMTRENWGGLYIHGNSALVVNTGFGAIGVPWRIDMPADVTIITLERIKPE